MVWMTLDVCFSPRDPGLGLLQQLVIAAGPGGDDDMTSLLDLLHSCPSSDLGLKTDILRCLVGCLKESHRCRTVFRRIGGFVYLMSVLVGLEGALGAGGGAGAGVERRAVFCLLHQIFATLAVAMRYEPANAKFFHQEIAVSSLAEALQLLGCFSAHRGLQSPASRQPPAPELMEALQTCFSSDLTEVGRPAPSPALAPELESCCLVLRLLHDLALDKFKMRSRPRSETTPSSSTPSLKSQTSVPGNGQVTLQKNILTI